MFVSHFKPCGRIVGCRVCICSCVNITLFVCLFGMCVYVVYVKWGLYNDVAQVHKHHLSSTQVQFILSLLCISCIQLGFSTHITYNRTYICWLPTRDTSKCGLPFESCSFPFNRKWVATNVCRCALIYECALCALGKGTCVQNAGNADVLGISYRVVSHAPIYSMASMVCYMLFYFTRPNNALFVVNK